jgi:hypothetical protein
MKHLDPYWDDSEAPDPEPFTLGGCILVVILLTAIVGLLLR